jgi:hypothetical protein
MIWNLEPAKPRSREHAMIWNLEPAKPRSCERAMVWNLETAESRTSGVWEIRESAEGHVRESWRAKISRTGEFTNQ